MLKVSQKMAMFEFDIEKISERVNKFWSSLLMDRDDDILQKGIRISSDID